MKRLLLLVLLAVRWVGCSKASDSSKQMPRLPPPPHPSLPASTRITVEIGGQERPPIDAARLASTRPDFEDPDHRAWRLSTLLGAHAAFAVTGENNVTVQFRPEGELQPALLFTRRGELVALLIDPREPFPPFHGQGRRMGRPGDPLPRISAVTRIRAE